MGDGGAVCQFANMDEKVMMDHFITAYGNPVRSTVSIVNVTGHLGWNAITTVMGRENPPLPYRTVATSDGPRNRGPHSYTMIIIITIV